MYATQQNFIDAFSYQEIVQLTNLFDPSAIVINAANLVQNQLRAKSIVDSYAASCPAIAAQMPFAAPYPELLIMLEMDVTRYFLDSIQAREDVRKRYEDAMRMLKDIAQCKLTLGLVGNPEVVSLTGSESANFDMSDRIFSKDNLYGL